MSGRRGGRPPRPARGYSWPTATPGNEIALKHGAYSAARVDPVAAELVETAKSAVAYLAAPEFEAALQAWGRAEARARLLAGWISENGLLDAKGKPRHAATFLVTCERQAAEARARLGLDPTSRAKLERDVAHAKFDISAAMQALDEEDERR